MTKEERREYNRQHYLKNKSRIREQQRSYQQSSEYVESIKRYQETDNYKQAIEKYQQSDKFRGSQRTYQKSRRMVDSAFRLIHNLRVRHRAVLRGTLSTTEGLGCSSQELRDHLEAQFTEGMCWDNYGHGEGKWTIDHIQPLSLVDAHPDLLPQLIHYTNLQPMWYTDNLKKSNTTYL